MSVTKTTMNQLAPAERAEVEDIVAAAIVARPRETERFVSDEGDTMAWYLLAFVAALAGLVAVIFDRATAYMPSPLLSFPMSPLGIVNNPTLPGGIVSIAVIVFTVVTFVRVHKRHGWMATTFAVVRVRGQKVRMLRYADVARVERRKVASGRRGFSMLTLTAKDGTTMTTYATRLMDAIEARVNETRSLKAPTGAP